MESKLNRGVSRVLSKLESSVKAGNYYEAHQMYRSLYFRYLGRKEYIELLDLLYNGSILLLQHEQYVSGADLGILFIDVLHKSDEKPSEQYYDKLAKLFSMMNAASPERDTFLQNMLAWSKSDNNYKTGHPDLHARVAQILWKEKNYGIAKQHFLYSKDGFGCATMLLELHDQQGYMNEIDLFITQAVLQYLCLRNKATAQEVFNSYTAQHPKINNDPPYILPLLNFLFFLLKSIDRGNVAVFSILCEQYRISLVRDPTYLQYLDKIGQLFFNIPPSRLPSRGLFGTFLQTFFSGLQDSDVDDDQLTRAASSQIMHELD